MKTYLSHDIVHVRDLIVNAWVNFGINNSLKLLPSDLFD